MTLKSNLLSEPILPTTHSPVLTPIPILSGLQQSEVTTPITELHTYYNIMQDRILEYQNDNDFPKDWNGTYVATSK